MRYTNYNKRWDAERKAGLRLRACGLGGSIRKDEERREKGLDGAPGRAEKGAKQQRPRGGEGKKMGWMEKRKRVAAAAAILLGAAASGASVAAAGEVVSAVEGKVEHVDRATKTIVVKSADGTEHTIHLVDHTVVHDAKGTTRGAEGAARNLGQGAQVVVHYSEKGSVDTADEVDHIGKGGLKEADGTVSSIDRKAKTLTVKGKDGAEHVYQLSDHAAADAGKDTQDAAKKSAKVTVYYTEEGGQRIAHFFRTAF